MMTDMITIDAAPRKFDVMVYDHVVASVVMSVSNARPVTSSVAEPSLEGIPSRSKTVSEAWKRK